MFTIIQKSIGRLLLFLYLPFMIDSFFYAKIWVAILLIVSLSCQTDAPVLSNTITIRLASEPEQVDPLLARTLADRQLSELLFLPLLDYDPQTLEMVPVLAEDFPSIKKITDGLYSGGTAYDFTIRAAARWDNGDPVTAKDYIFTFKTLLHPNVNAAPFRAYFNFLKAIEPDPDNPKKFRVITDRPYILALEALGSIGIYPAYHYDPGQVLEKIKMGDLTDSERADSLVKNNASFAAFAADFNNKKTTSTVGGSAYQLTAWTANQQLILQKKENHWTNSTSDLPDYLRTIPDKLIFKIIPDINSAISLLQSEKLDVLTDLPSGQIPTLQEELVDHYNFYTPKKLVYYYIGINGNQPYLNQPDTRRAVAHLVEVDFIIKNLFAGYAQRTIGPIHPSKSYYNTGLAPIEYDPAKATQYLEKQGWEMAANGILYKKINGKNMPLRLRYAYHASNQTAEEVGILLQKSARAIGIEVIPEAMEIKSLLTAYRQRDYDLIYLKWTVPSGLDDLRQIWHSTGNVAGGSNRTGFGDAVSDEIIDKIRVSYSPKIRKELYFRIQNIIYQEQPYIFLYTPLERMAIHKRFKMKPTAHYPGYTITQFNVR